MAKKIKRPKRKQAKFLSRFNFNSRYLSLIIAVFMAVGAFFIIKSLARYQPSAEEKSAMQQINSYRAANGLPAFKASDCLYTAAHEWSRRMSDTANFGHGGLSIFVPQLCPDSFTGMGENIGKGSSFAGILADWQQSPSHNDLLLSSGDYAGIGLYTYGTEIMATLIAGKCRSGCNNEVTAPVRPTPQHVTPADKHVYPVCTNGVRIASVPLVAKATISSGTARSLMNYRKETPGVTTEGNWSQTTWSSFLSSGTSFTRSINVSSDNAGSTYSWEVVSMSSSGYTGRSSIRTFSIAADKPPTEPADFQASNQTANSITLSWGASSDDCQLVNYDLYRTEFAGAGTDGGVGLVSAKRLIASPPATATSYTDTGVKTVGYYAYELCAIDNYSTPQRTCKLINVTKTAL